MERQIDLERLLQRHGEIQRAMRKPGGIRITVERELLAIREQLKRFPQELMLPDTNKTLDHAEGPGGRDRNQPLPHTLRKSLAGDSAAPEARRRRDVLRKGLT